MRTFLKRFDFNQGPIMLEDTNLAALYHLLLRRRVHTNIAAVDKDEAIALTSEMKATLAIGTSNGRNFRERTYPRYVRSWRPSSL